MARRRRCFGRQKRLHSDAIAEAVLVHHLLHRGVCSGRVHRSTVYLMKLSSPATGSRRLTCQEGLVGAGAGAFTRVLLIRISPQASSRAGPAVASYAAVAAVMRPGSGRVRLARLEHSFRLVSLSDTKHHANRRRFAASAPGQARLLESPSSASSSVSPQASSRADPAVGAGAAGLIHQLFIGVRNRDVFGV
jgi:hypothetical protein